MVNLIESQTTEFKQIWKDDYLKTICAFANSDGVVMYNGATLSDEVPIEKFTQTHQSKPFNPTLVNVFYKCEFIENWGRGTLNIIDDCINYGLPKPTFEYEWTAVRVTFYKAKKSEGIKKLYNYIKENPNRRISQISKELQIPSKTLERWIKQLREENKIEYRGSKKTGGYWVVLDEK